MNVQKVYESIFMEICFNSKNFGFKREELIDDFHARILYPELKKLGFILDQKRITSMSRSKGDLIVYKNNKKLTIEITNLGGKASNSRYKYIKYRADRDLLIGKIIRLITLNDCKVLFIFNKKIDKTVLNEDFKKIIKKYKVKILFTNFKKGWEKALAKKIDNSFKLE